MEYRRYGRQKIVVSAIGVGGHQEGVEVGNGLSRTARFYRTDHERAAVVSDALDQGITYFDTTFGCELASLGRVLQLLKRRDHCFVSAMRVDFFANLQQEETDVRTYTRREVEARLLEFGYDAVDQFMLGAVEVGDPLSTPAAVEGALEELDRLKDEGKLTYVGFSCHNPDYAAQLLQAYPQFDAVMTPYNFANRAAEGALSEALRATGAAWIAMKPLVWHLYGLPVTALRHITRSPLDGGRDVDRAFPVAEAALRHVLQNPQITTCVTAMNAADHVTENVGAVSRGPLSAGEQAALEAYAAEMRSHRGIPLAIGGLAVDNLRVRHFALNLLQRELSIGPYAVDWDGDDAEVQAANAAAAALAEVQADAEWGHLLS